MIDILSKQNALHIKGTQQKMMISSVLNIAIFCCQKEGQNKNSNFVDAVGAKKE